jgi:hypothetical protein
MRGWRLACARRDEQRISRLGADALARRADEQFLDDRGLAKT